MNIPFINSLQRWTKDPIKINWKTKNKNRIFVNIQKQEDTQYYTRRQGEYISIPFEPLRRWSKIKTKNVYKTKMKIEVS